MVTSDPSAMINAAICAVIVLVLMFYQREGARHRPLISLTAYFAVLVYATVPCLAFIMNRTGLWYWSTSLFVPLCFGLVETWRVL